LIRFVGIFHLIQKYPVRVRKWLGISAFRAEQEMIKQKIAFFESNKPKGFIESPAKVTLPVQPQMQPVKKTRKPKKSKQ